MYPTLCDNTYPDEFAVDVQLWHLCALDVILHSNQNTPSISVAIFPVDTVLRREELGVANSVVQPSLCAFHQVWLGAHDQVSYLCSSPHGRVEVYVQQAERPATLPPMAAVSCWRRHSIWSESPLSDGHRQCTGTAADIMVEGRGYELPLTSWSKATRL